MTTLYARHEVEDFDRWKEAYENFEAVRRSMGVTAQRVFRSHDNPHDITVVHEFENAEAAQAFAGSPRLRDAMVNAGVKGEPAIWITEKV